MASLAERDAVTTMKRSVVAAALCAALLVALGAWLVVRSPRTLRAPAAAASSEEAPSLLRFAWTPGREYVYALHAHTVEHARLGDGAAAQPVDGELRVDGEMVVRCYAADGGTYVLGVSLRALDTASLVVAGQQGIADAADVAGKEILLDVDARGRTSRERVRASLPPASKHVLRRVAALLGATLPEDAKAHWEADEPTVLGVAHASYRADGPRAFARRHAHYASLSALRAGDDPRAAQIAGEDRSTIAEDGALGTARIDETVTVGAGEGARLSARVEATIARRSVEGFVATLPVDADLEDASGRSGREAAAARRAALDAMSAGMSLDGLEARVAAFGAGARLEPGFLTSATALLRMEPAYAEALVEIFERPRTNGAMRGLICDLLVSASTHAAQVALRDVLSSDAARADARLYPQLVQRVAFVVAPEPATVDFAYKLYASGPSGEAHTTAAYALGSSIGALARSGERVRAASYATRLRGALERTKRSEDRVTLLASLGNAGMVENVPLIRRFTHDDSASVRRESALALRKVDVPEAHAALVDLLGDADGTVASAALGAIAGARVDDARMRELAAFVSGGPFAGELNEGLLGVAASHSESREAAAALASAVLANTQDPHTAARARMILVQLGVGAG
jgi:hypothetical protein